MEKALKEINKKKPDLVVVPGDLTTAGYRDQFEEAKEYISLAPANLIIQF